MYNYRWTIERIDGHPAINGLSNVISEVAWELEIRDTEDYSVHYIRQTTKLDTTSVTSDTFTDILLLTDEQVLQWIWDIEGKETIETRALQELNDLRSPKPDAIVPLSMMWKANCCPDGTGM